MSNMVYLITFNNGMFYIGSTNNICRRERQHRKRLSNDKHKNDKMLAAFKECGDFDIFSVECRSRRNAFELEDDLLERYRYHVGICNELKSALPGTELSEHPQETELCKIIENL